MKNPLGTGKERTMAVFQNADELYECIGGLFDWAKEDPEVAPKLIKTGLVIRLHYTLPDAVISIDCRGKVDWKRGVTPDPADVEFFMKGDIGHRFWLGKVSLLVALAKRDITCKGALTKVMRILPILKPLYAQYPRLLEAKGKSALAAV